MDKFTDLMLGEQVGLLGMIGKSERGPEAIASIKAQQVGVYCMAVGGAAYLVAKAIKSRPRARPSRNSAWKRCTSSTWRTCRSPLRWTATAIRVHDSGPKEWQMKIGKIPVKA
jgi:fumarate hydratase, class I